MKTHDQKLAELRAASAQLAVRRETECAAIDEAIATHRAADPDHYLTQPMDSQEAAHNREIAALKRHLTKLHVVAWKCLSELGDYPCRRDEMTEQTSQVAAMVESLVSAMQYIEKAAINEVPPSLPLVGACAKAISDLDRVTSRPLTVEDQARAVLECLANEPISRSSTVMPLELDARRLDALLELDIDVKQADGGGWLLVDWRENPPRTTQHETGRDAIDAALANTQVSHD